MISTIVWFACSGGGDVRQPPDPLPGSTPPTVEALPPFVPAPATLHRITDAEWRNSVEDLFDHRYEGILPLDYALHGYIRVGASTQTVGPLDMEQYETAAWAVAQAVVPDVDAGLALYGCAPDHAGCVSAWAAGAARRAWRRPPTADEVAVLESLYDEVRGTTTDLLALQAPVAAMLQSSWFLFRVEVGVPDPEDPTRRRYDDHELAGRLASFLTASVPDAALMDVADAGRLTDGTVTLLAEAQRLMQTDRAREALTEFFAETMELDQLDSVTKDAVLYPEFTDALRAEMAGELRLLFKDLALDRGAPLSELLTTSTAFVGPELADLYGVAAGSGPVAVDLPSDQDRGGILGRAAIATIHSHNTQTSPTHRGKFVRGRLLCQSIPPPPPGVLADLDMIDGEGTLRDRLSQHADDPACSGCHDAMDPLGYALEYFDPIGRRRALDNGLPIDATGDLDGVTFDGAAGLGIAVAEHPELPGCMALQLYRHAGGQAERLEELIAVASITDAFVAGDQRFEALVLALIASEAFTTASAPLGEICDVEGDRRGCTTACGDGEETCTDGLWRGCDAEAPRPETCNGVDDDCDGTVDVGVVAACWIDDGPGLQTCDDAMFDDCVGPVPPPPPIPDEVCNGLDDDGDGDIDEDLEVAITVMTHTELIASHGSCDMNLDPRSGPCRAAMHRACGATSCAVSGYGPVVERPTDADVVCLAAEEAIVVSTTYTTLVTHHPGCTEAVTMGPACNAAMSRFCGSQGWVTGMGPVEHSGDTAVVMCTPGATVLDASYAADLILYETSCDGFVEREGPACTAAIHAYCRDLGYASGHGPTENYGDLAVVACMGVL